jgi:hypothetical protein
MLKISEVCKKIKSDIRKSFYWLLPTNWKVHCVLIVVRGHIKVTVLTTTPDCKVYAGSQHKSVNRSEQQSIILIIIINNTG